MFCDSDERQRCATISNVNFTFQLNLSVNQLSLSKSTQTTALVTAPQSALSFNSSTALSGCLSETSQVY